MVAQVNLGAGKITTPAPTALEEVKRPDGEGKTRGGKWAQ